MVDPPRLLEVVRTDDVPSLAGVLEATTHRCPGAGRGPPGQPGRQQPPVRTDLRERRRGAAADGRRRFVRDRRRRPPTWPPRSARPSPTGARGRSRSTRRPTTAVSAGPPRPWPRPSSRWARSTRWWSPWPVHPRGTWRGPARRAGGSGFWPSTSASSTTSTPTRAGAGRWRTSPPRPTDRFASSRSSTPPPPVAAAGRRPRPSSPGRRRPPPTSRVAAFAVSVEVPVAEGGEVLGQIVAHLRLQPRGLRAGRGRVGGRCRVVRSAQPPAPGRQHHLRRPRRSRLARRHAPEHRRKVRWPHGGRPGWHATRGGRMSRRPSRVVDAHVHLWDPARTDWYPYLSGGQELDMGDVTGMSRRFDVPTYMAESAGWNVEKLVNVAAATGRHSIEETLELNRRADVEGHPDAIVGGLPPTDSVAEAIELLDRQMTASRVPGGPPDGGLQRSVARGRGASRPGGAGPAVRADGSPRPAPVGGDHARRVRRAGGRRRAHRAGPGRAPPRSAPCGPRASTRWPVSATTSSASCRAWPCRWGR